jgi:hypothetical protein
VDRHLVPTKVVPNFASKNEYICLFEINESCVQPWWAPLPLLCCIFEMSQDEQRVQRASARKPKLCVRDLVVFGYEPQICIIRWIIKTRQAVKNQFICYWRKGTTLISVAVRFHTPKKQTINGIRRVAGLVWNQLLTRILINGRDSFNTTRSSQLLGKLHRYVCLWGASEQKLGKSLKPKRA